MEKTIFVGDRVKLRGYCTIGKDVDGQKGVVIEVRENNVVRVTIKENHCVKISQCIKLVKRPPKYYWVGKARFDDAHALWKPLVALEIEPVGLDCEGASFRRVMVIRS